MCKSSNTLENRTASWVAPFFLPDQTPFPLLAGHELGPWISRNRAVMARLAQRDRLGLIAKMKRDRFGQSSERGQRLLDRMELQLEELEASAAGDEAVVMLADTTAVVSFTRRKPVRAPLPAHLPRERVVVPAPSTCSCCGGRLAKLGEDITETLEVVPRQWKVIQTVREKSPVAAARRSPSPRRRSIRSRAGAPERAC